MLRTANHSAIYQYLRDCGVVEGSSVGIHGQHLLSFDELVLILVWQVEQYHLPQYS
jgi:hypothetical protein